MVLIKRILLVEDDYITKPFRLRELLARVKRTLNAGNGADKSDFLTIGDARIDMMAD